MVNDFIETYSIILCSALFDFSGLKPLSPLEVVFLHGSDETLLDEGSVNYGSAYDVWVHVGGGSSILNITLLFSSGGSWDSDGASSVTGSIGEHFFVGSLVMSCQSLFVVTVKGNVEGMLGGHSVKKSFNVVHATDLSHVLGREVSVATCTVPVLEELGLEADGDAEVFSNAAEEISGDPELISSLNAEAGADLVLPLAGHNLAVGAGDLDGGEQASLVVSINDGTTVADVGTNRAVVGSLGSGESR